MPGVTVEEARLYTDPARREVDMVFQFEHMRVDQGDSKWDLRPLRLTELKATLGRWQDGSGGRGLEQPVLEQPRPAARRVPLRRRRRAPRALGQGARHRPAHASRDAVRLPGRGARDDERALRLDRRLPRHRVAQPLRRGGRRGRGSRRRARRAAHDGPRQRPHADAVGRERARRLHDRRRRGSRSTRTTRRSTPRPSAPTPTPCSTTTAG